MVNIPLKELTYTVLDTETTGIGINSSDIIELAAVQVKPGFELDFNSAFSELIRPRFPISYNAFKVHNISPDMVADKPFIEDILPTFFEYSKDSIACGHNIIKFDIAYIKNAAKKNLFKLPYLEIIDTLKLTKKLFKGSINYKLTTLTDYFKINIDTMPLDSSGKALPKISHRALYDALCTAEVLIRCLKALEVKGIVTLEDLKKHKLL